VAPTGRETHLLCSRGLSKPRRSIDERWQALRFVYRLEDR